MHRLHSAQERVSKYDSSVTSWDIFVGLATPGQDLDCPIEVFECNVVFLGELCPCETLEDPCAGDVGQAALVLLKNSRTIRTGQLLIEHV